METPETTVAQPAVWPLKMKLRTPVHFAGETITELSFQKPRGRHFRGIPVGGLTAGDIFDCAARIANVPPGVIDAIEDGEDLAEVSSLAANFIAGFLAIGPTPSP